MPLSYVEAVKLCEHFLTRPLLLMLAVFAFILDALRNNQLDPEYIVSQGYDGASVMSAGVQLCEVVPTCTAMLTCFSRQYKKGI